MKAFALVMVLVTSGCATQDWRPRDTALEIAYQTLNVIDASQTARIHKTPGIVEEAWPTREILSESPDPGRTYLYFASIGLSHYLIARALPPKWRPYFAGVWLYVSIDNVRDNHQLGLGP